MHQHTTIPSNTGVEFPTICFRGEMYKGRPEVSGAVIDPACAALRENAIDIKTTPQGYILQLTILDFRSTLQCGNLSEQIARARLQQVIHYGANFRPRVYPEIQGIDLSSTSPIPSITISIAFDNSWQFDKLLNCESTTFIDGQVISYEDFDELAQLDKLDDPLNQLFKEAKKLHIIPDESPGKTVVNTFHRLASTSIARWSRLNHIPLIVKKPKNLVDQVVSTSLSNEDLVEYLANCAAPYRRFADSVNLRQLLAHFSGQPLPYDSNELSRICEDTDRKWLLFRNLGEAKSKRQELIQTTCDLTQMDSVEIAALFRILNSPTHRHEKMRDVLHNLLLNDDAFFERVFPVIFDLAGGVVIHRGEVKYYCRGSKSSFVKSVDDTIEHRRTILANIGKPKIMKRESTNNSFDKDLELQAQQKFQQLFTSEDLGSIVRLLAVTASCLELDPPQSTLKSGPGKLFTVETEITIPGLSDSLTATASAKKKQEAIKFASKLLLKQLHDIGEVDDSIWTRAIILTYFSEQYAKNLASKVSSTKLLKQGVRNYFEENGFEFISIGENYPDNIKHIPRLGFAIQVENFTLMNGDPLCEVIVELKGANIGTICYKKMNGTSEAAVKSSAIQQTIKLLEQVESIEAI